MWRRVTVRDAAVCLIQCRPINGARMTDDQSTTDALFCPKCDYSLRGLGPDTDSCPECGETFSLEELSRPQVPWSHRREIGRCRAYWRTVWLVTFRNHRFCREVCRPVSWSDAQRFRWVTVLHAYAGLVLLTPTVDEALNVDWEAIGWPVALGYMCLPLWLVAVTGLPSYWFHPRALDKRRQSRAVALSYYACAPLAWMPLTAVLLGAGLCTYHELLAIELPFVLGYALAALQLLGWWLVPVQMARRIAQRSDLGAMTLAGALPVCSLLFGILIFVGIPLLIGYVLVIIESLR